MMDTVSQKTGLEERVQRLVASGLCTAESASKHVKELKQLAESKLDEQSVKRQSRIFKALSDPTRLKIIKLLSIRDMCVCEIMAALDMTQPTASHHLNLLESAGLLSDRRQGKWVFYSLANPKILSAISKTPSLLNP